MLGAIRAQLVAAGTVLSETWETEVSTWGQKVAIFRRYQEGDHDAKLTAEMKDMLRIQDGVLDNFTLNYCDLVVAKMADRLTVTGIAADTEQGTAWAGEVLEDNRFDGLHMDVHEASLRDGITFVMVAAKTDGSAMFVHELCWDNDTGVIPIYDRMGKKIVAAVKVWYETSTARRVNIYYPDRVEKFSEDGNQLRAETGGKVDWQDAATGKPVGVPFVPFVNRGGRYGLSEIAGVKSAQDATNRTLVSMVMTSELSAFQIKVAVGFAPPAKVTPGMIIKIGEEGLSNDQKVDMFTLEQAQLVPFINQANFLIDQIGTVSQTPLPAQMGGDAASGESLKQRESGLVGKVKRFQVKGGNAWEDVMALAVAVQNAYGKTKPPTVKRWNCKWQSAEVRNDAEVVRNVKEAREIMGDQQALKELASVFKWDEAKVKEIEAQKLTATARSLAMMTGGNAPNFNDFTVQ